MDRIVAILLPVLIVGGCWLFVWRSSRASRRRERRRWLELQAATEPRDDYDTPLERLLRLSAELKRELDKTKDDC